MTDTIVSFKTAKLANKKGFNEPTLYFYTKPNSKMFGIDEENRAYPIKNTAKKLYVSGEEAALNIENVYGAPTQSLLQKWLREKHKIYIEITHSYRDLSRYTYHVYTTWDELCAKITKSFANEIRHFENYEDALEEGLYQALLLSPDKK